MVLSRYPHLEDIPRIGEMECVHPKARVLAEALFQRGTKRCYFALCHAAAGCAGV